MFDPDIANTILLLVLLFLSGWVVSFVPRYRATQRSLVALRGGRALLRPLEELMERALKEQIEAALQFDTVVIAHRLLPVVLLDNRLAITAADGEFLFRVARDRSARRCCARVLMSVSPDDLLDVLRQPAGQPACGQETRAISVSLPRDDEDAATAHAFTPVVSGATWSRAGTPEAGRAAGDDDALRVDAAHTSGEGSGAGSGQWVPTAELELDMLVFSTRQRREREHEESGSAGGGGDASTLAEEVFTHPICAEQLTAIAAAPSLDCLPLAIVLDADVTTVADWGVEREHGIAAGRPAHIRLAYVASITDNLHSPTAAAAAAFSPREPSTPTSGAPPAAASTTLTVALQLRFLAISGRGVFEVQEVFIDEEGADHLLKPPGSGAPPLSPPLSPTLSGAFAGSTVVSLSEADEDLRFPCIACYTNRKRVITVPCGHLCLCSVCARRVSTCPICRRTITDVITLLL